MRQPHPQSWAGSVMGFALAVLVACFALNLAARLLVAVLPVLIGLVVVAALVFLARRLR